MLVYPRSRSSTTILSALHHHYYDNYPHYDHDYCYHCALLLYLILSVFFLHLTRSIRYILLIIFFYHLSERKEVRIG